MKKPIKGVNMATLAAFFCPVLLTAIGTALLVMGQLWSWRGLWLLGLAGLLPGVVQLVQLLPVLTPTEPPETGKIKLFFHKLRLWYIKRRSVIVSLCVLAAGVGCLLLWRIKPTAQAQLGYHIPIIAAAVFVICAAAEKWCEYLADDTRAGTQVTGLASGFFMLRMSCIGVVVASLLKLTGLFDADAVLEVVLTLVLCYEALSLAFSLAVRLIHKDLDTKPELLCRLSGMGKDKNILSYLEENTGITMRSLWSLQLIKTILPGAVLAVVLLLWLATCFVQIGPNQEGALFRLGKMQDATLQPGLHVTLPWPIDQVDVYDTRNLNRLSIGYVSQGDQDNIWTEDHGGEEYLLLLGDGNEMVAINLEIQYRIDDLVSYIRSGSQPEAILQAQAYEIITSRTIGTDLDALLSTDREVFSETFNQELSQRLAPYNTGLTVVDVVLESIHPPVRVADVYQDLISAEIDAEYTLINAQNTAYQHISSAEKERTQAVGNAKAAQYESVAQAQAAVTEFMAAANADSAYRDAYRFYKYINAVTGSYQGTRLIIVGQGVDSGKLVIGALPAPEPTVEETYPEEEVGEEMMEE